MRGRLLAAHGGMSLSHPDWFVAWGDALVEATAMCGARSFVIAGSALATEAIVLLRRRSFLLSIKWKV